MKKFERPFKIFKESPKNLIFTGGEPVFSIRDAYLRLSTRKIRILMVVDTSVEIGVNDGFGIGRVTELLRETRVGCTEFIVDIAQRPTVFGGDPGDLVVNNAAGPGEAKYYNFRFNSVHDGELILDNYHEMFLFGFAPDNFAGPDTRITDHYWHTTDDELEVIEDWMNAGGGIFATGDHDYLGASMCHQIPRVGTMRKWTNADGVPPIDGPTRLDTNVPVSVGQINGSIDIPNFNESDGVPQLIEWIPMRTIQSGLFQTKYPHEILCHPTHGVINVMPDHPHEGCCVEPGDINFNANVKYGTSKEYPVLDGFQPKPRIIAYGNIKAKDNHQKGSVNAARFPMISVYDGRENNTSNTGRVVVDSTWHHWFNLNLVGLEAADDQTNWEKISRFFVNIAVWIAPKNIFREYCWWELLRQHFTYPALREIQPRTPILEVGITLRDSLTRSFGKCGVTNLVYTHICQIRPSICEIYQIPEFPDPLDPICLTCPPFEILEALVLGNIFRQTEKLASSIKEVLYSQKKNVKVGVQIEELEKLALEGTEKGVELFANQVQKGFDEIGKKINSRY
ncbi:MAG: hypothetical protein MRZ79_23510 [Bacteroidia bacterium]|nr:hypothetical protein [Bacteroidia bacterium]